jgi:hypothetical protein
MSARVRSSHARPLSTRNSMDWSGPEVTGQDTPVDGWWTAERLSVAPAGPAAFVAHPGHERARRGSL